MAKYNTRNNLTESWHPSQFYVVDDIPLAYDIKYGEHYICPYGEPPMTRCQLERRGHVVVSPRIPRFS